MKKFVFVGLVVVLLALVLSSCMNVNKPSSVMPIRDAITAAGSSTTSATVVGVVTYGYGDYVIIQDDTAAIEVYEKNSGFASIYSRGDKLRVYGTVENYKNNWEIVPSATMDVVKIGTATVTAKSIPMNTTIGATDDWMLMKVTNLTVEKPADKYYNVVLKNGNADVTIYSYDSSVRKWLTSLATGDTVSAQGIVKYSYGWKLILRDANDELK